MVVIEPKLVLLESSIAPGMVVADFGAGSGHYTLAVAEMVGVAGKVYAIEVQSGLVQRLQQEVERRGFQDRVISLWGDIEKPGGTSLATDSVDVVIMANVLFQTSDPKNAWREAARVLKPGGSIICIDWDSSCHGAGPQSSAIYSGAIAEKDAREIGGEILNKLTPGPCHYGFVSRLAIKNQ